MLRSGPGPPRRRPFTFEAVFDPGLFDRDTVDRLLGHFATLLEAGVAEPGRGLWSLPLLTGAELARILGVWNDTRRPYPESSTIPDLFAEQAARAPDAAAVVDAAGRITYRELDHRSDRLAAHLRRLGVGPDVLVGTCLERSVDLIVALLGVVKAGGAYVPLDPHDPPDRLAFMLEDTRVPVVLTQESLVSRLRSLEPDGLPGEVRRRRPRAEIVCLDGSEPQRGGVGPTQAGDGARPSEAESGASRVLRPEHLAYVSYTSGSTGRPKGVAVPHRAVVRLVKGANYARLAPDEVFLQLAPVSFDASTLEIWGALLNGATLAIAPPGPLSLSEIGRAVKAYGVTILWLTAGLFGLMVGEQVEALRGVRQLLFGGDVVPLAQVARAARELPGCRLVNGYGPTENTTFTACHRVEADPEGSGRPLPIGRPVTNTTVYVLDRHLNLLPAGVPGELYAGGAGLARGYVGRADLTAERFVPDPFGTAPGGRLYRTGDLVRFLPDGTLEFLGRFDHQVKIRGYRVEPAEVEANLAAHPQVREVAVLAREDRPGDKRLVAYVVPKAAGGARLVEALRGFLAARLPEWMIPSAFVCLEAMPLNPIGKIDRRTLPAPPAAGSAGPGRPSVSEGQPGPARRLTPTQKTICAIWAEVLGLDVAEIGGAGFFDLGGNSLLATQAVSRVRSRLGLEVPLRTVFDHPTVEAFAAVVEEARREGATAPGAPGPPAPPPLTARGAPAGRAQSTLPASPLSFAQQRLLFFDRIAPASPLYNIPVTVRLRGHLDAGALAGALEDIVRRHEVLRTVYAASGEGEPVQVLGPAGAVAVPAVDLGGLEASAREPEAWRLATEEVRRPFDLSRGPLVRALLLRLDEEDHLLVLTIHHIAADGWSMGILVREMAEFYAARRGGRPPTLPELPVQYADFARWQRGWLGGEVLEREVAYWRGKLAGLPPLLDLPTDRPRRAAQSFRGGLIRFDWPGSPAHELHELCRAQGASRFMALMAAFAVLLARYSGQLDLAVGVAVANRTRAEIEPLIGFFVNTLPLRVDLSGDPSFGELLRRVRETSLEAFAHQDLPFEKLVDAFRPERNLSHMPLVQVLFAYQNAPFEPLRLEGLTVADMEVDKLDTGTAKTDLVVTVEDTGSGLGGYFQYSADLFEEVTCAWNDTARRYPADRTVDELLAEQARRTPEAVAVVDAGGASLTYAGLDRRSDLLAGFLEGLGVTPETLVGFAVERSLDMVVGLAGILKAGGAYVPLDPDYPTERLAYMLEDTRAPVLVTQENVLRTFSLRLDSGIKVVCLDRDWPAIEKAGQGRNRRAEPDSLAYVIYTSGSTGRPKGVAVTHRGIVRLVRGATYSRFSGSEVYLQASPIAFDASTFEIWGALLNGARLALMPAGTPDLRELARVLVTRGVTTAFLTTALFNLVVEREPQALAGLRQVLFGGETASVAHALGAARLLPDGAVLNLYGPTENTTFTTFHPVPAEHDPDRPLPIGRPVTNTMVYVLDERLEPAPLGVPGELFTGGDGLARGYLGRPDLTAERFVPDPVGPKPGARLYRTGDRARWLPDGTLEFLGRLDEQVKIRGFRVELGEIEAALHLCEGVTEAAVVARDDPSGTKRLVAYVAAASRPDPAGLRTVLRRTLPGWMVPSSFVFLDALPLGPTGKVDRHSLPEPPLGSEPQPEGGGGTAGRPALTATEAAVSRAWAEVLGRESDGPDRDFFEAGGQSLLAIRLASRLSEVFGVEVGVRHVFESPTIRGLAALIDSGRLPGTAPQATAAQTAAASIRDLAQALPEMTEEELDAFLAELPEIPKDGGGQP